MGTSDDNLVEELVDLDSTENCRTSSANRSSSSPTITRTLPRRPASSLIPSFSNRPRDATPIMRPSRNFVAFMPIDTLNTSRSQHSKLLKHSDSSLNEHDPSRKRKRESIHERMKGRPTTDASQTLSNGLLVSRTTSPDKEKSKTINTDGDNAEATKHHKNDSNTTAPVDVSHNILSSSPPATQQVSLPKSNFKKPQHPPTKTVSLKIHQLRFGSYTSSDDDLVFAITIMPKRIESVSEILRNAELMNGFNFATEKFLKLTYCLTTRDVVLTLKSRHSKRYLQGFKMDLHANKVQLLLRLLRQLIR
ncbi:uncharacterized protein V1513DRAFT_372108 [Lipomyces chichibuensis]|uniref:uncharacterized protein n=1 Tax=Lipomyces chichibuensis TaxID=1546026 RepID=UPI003343B8C7